MKHHFWNELAMSFVVVFVVFAGGTVSCGQEKQAIDPMEKQRQKVELRHFLECAKEEKTQTIIAAFLKSGGQTEREATDFQGVFADTAAELSR